LYTTNNAVLGKKAVLEGNGQWTWNGYAALPAQTDGSTYKPLGIDSSGNVVKMADWMGSGGAAATKQSFCQTATTTVAATNAETSLLSSGTGSLTIPAAAWFAGKSFKISVRGVYSTSATNPAGIRFTIKLGSTIIAQSPSIFLGSNKADVNYEVRADLTCRSTGASGSLYTMGMFFSNDDKFGKIDHGTAAATVDLSGNQTLNITATFSDASAGNSISAFIVTFEAIN
jgi:hypothetical protein